MAKKPTVTTITSGFASVTTLNANYEALRDAFDNTISRDGSTPNTMTADFDMNSNDILNVKSITDQSGKDIVAQTKVNADAAEAAKVATEAAADEFGDIYLGSKTSDPTVDNDGDALQTGAIYYNSTNNELRVYSGTGFNLGIGTAGGSVVPIVRGGTGATNAADARTNLDVDQAGTALALAIALG